jgi:hypothetical protein
MQRYQSRISLGARFVVFGEYVFRFANDSLAIGIRTWCLRQLWDWLSTTGLLAVTQPGAT